MLPTRSYVTSGQSTQLSWTRTHFRPATAAAAATWRVWFDWTPPIETSVSQPCASASATRYSSLRVLLPPKARPEFTSSRFAQIAAPAEVRRQAVEAMDGRRAEGQRVPRERFQRHDGSC